MKWLYVISTILSLLVCFLSWKLWDYSVQNEVVDKQVIILDDKIEVGLSKQHAQTISNVMNEYFQAYFSQDKLALSKVLDSSVVWFLHIGDLNSTGKQIKGREHYFKTVKLRFSNWQNLSFTNNEIRVLSDGKGFVHSYEIAGQNIHSGPFHAKALDVYVLKKGKISQRDSYWKIESVQIETELRRVPEGAEAI